MSIENYDRSDKPKKNNIRTVGYKQGLVWVGLGYQVESWKAKMSRL